MRQAARVLAATCGIGLALVGAPLVLLRMVGRPRLRQVPDPAGVVDPQQVHDLISTAAGLLGWLAWAVFAAVVSVGAGRLLAGRPRRLPRLRLPGPLQSRSPA